MIPHGFSLGVDFGTSNTAGVLRWPDGTTKPLLFDDSPLLPSAVYADPDGAMLTGRDALHAARARPECFEPNPKRRIDDGVVLLGDRELPVTELVAAVLARVADEARRVTGGATPATTLTYPAAWGPRRRRILIDAAVAAGLGEPDLVAEPVAAASYFVTRPGTRLPVGSCAVVYDFGGGTFDASVVRRTATGFDVLAARGLDDAGGLDVDEALMAHLGAVYSARDAATWRKLARPETPADRRANRLLREDVRTGKEMLSRAGSTLIHIPLLEDDAPLGREQFEQLAGPVLSRTVAATWSTIQSAGIPAGDVAAVFLVGGSSRIPLAATLLHRRLKVSPTAIEQPELVVAEGSLHAAPARPDPEPATVVFAPPDELPKAVRPPVDDLPGAVWPPTDDVPGQEQPAGDEPPSRDEPVPGALASDDWPADYTLPGGGDSAPAGGDSVPHGSGTLLTGGVRAPEGSPGETWPAAGQSTGAGPSVGAGPAGAVGGLASLAPPVHLETSTASAARQWRHLVWGLLIGGGSLACGATAIAYAKTAPLTVCTAVELLLYAAYRLAGPATPRQRIPYVLAGLLALVGAAMIASHGSANAGDISYLLPVVAIFGIGAGLLELAGALVGAPGLGRGTGYAIGVVLLVVGATDAPTSDSDAGRTVQALTLVIGVLLFGLLVIVAGVRRVAVRR